MEDESIFRLLEGALTKGAEAAEIYRIEQESTLVDIKEGKIDSLSREQQVGIGLRVWEKQRLGFVFASHWGGGSGGALIGEALAAARSSHPDSFLRIPAPPASPYAELEAYDSSLKTMGLAERVHFARMVEDTARRFDPRVSKIRHCLYRDSDYTAQIRNSHGLKVEARGTHCTCSLEVVAEEKGSSETGWDMQSSSFFSDLQAEEVGRRAAEQAVSMLGARVLPTTVAEAIFSPATAAEFLEVISSALKADVVQKGKSLFKDRVASKVAADGLTLVDDGLLPRGSNSFPFDDEGIPSQRTPLIEKGVLRGFLYDSYWGAREGKPSTGNARRAGFQSPPQISVTNLYPAPGRRTKEEMVKDVSKGALVLSLMGMHTANPISGDFSVGVEGLWIERGKLHLPFRGMTIAGNIRDWLRSLEEVGSDLRFFGSHGSPSLRVSKIQFAGS
jgi:PmbA protein